MGPSPVTFEFVVLDPVRDPKPGKSTQIRSRCMKGKNTREGSRRTQREQRKAEKERKRNEENLSTRLNTGKPCVELVPLGTVISDFSLATCSFAGAGIDLEAKNILHKAFAYNFANQSLSPLDRLVDFDCLESEKFRWVFFDTAFLHSVLCTSYAINDFMSPHWDGNPSRKTAFHLGQSLSLLQTKMCNDHVHHDESFLQAIINLALLSVAYGDWSAAAIHYEGLHKIVRLRGDSQYLMLRPELHFRLDRIDLVRTLSSGKKPFFLQAAIAWEPKIEAPCHPLPTNLYPPSPYWDYRLVNIFRDFQYISLRINRGRLKFAHRNPLHAHAVFTSLQSRLTHLGDLIQNPMEEMVRLTMLALLTTTFRLPGRRIEYVWIVERLASMYRKVIDGPLHWDATLHRWVLITVAMTVAGPQEMWIREAWKDLDIHLGWAALKSDLVRIIWFEVLHDEPGEIAFQQLERFRLA